MPPKVTENTGIPSSAVTLQKRKSLVRAHISEKIEYAVNHRDPYVFSSNDEEWLIEELTGDGYDVEGTAMGLKIWLTTPRREPNSVDSTTGCCESTITFAGFGLIGFLVIATYAFVVGLERIGI
jgi:hypothetical protein